VRVVIQCAGSKRADAGSFRTAAGRRVAFVADPTLAPAEPGVLHAHPDGPSDAPGLTWRDLVVEANRRAQAGSGTLIPAGRLYAPKAYAALERSVGPEMFFILSAGWGLVRSDFLLPAYDITFSGSAKPHTRRRGSQAFADFNHLLGAGDEDTVFLGGKDYLPLFLRLTLSLGCRRLVFFNAVVPPRAPSCTVQAFPTPRRTNWHYACAEALAGGSLVPRFEA
jgi:hypothetical protein